MVAIVESLPPLLLTMSQVKMVSSVCNGFRVMHSLLPDFSQDGTKFNTPEFARSAFQILEDFIRDSWLRPNPASKLDPFALHSPDRHTSLRPEPGLD